MTNREAKNNDVPIWQYKIFNANKNIYKVAYIILLLSDIQTS